jgi:hypothetical protein
MKKKAPASKKNDESLKDSASSNGSSLQFTIEHPQAGTLACVYDPEISLNEIWNYFVWLCSKKMRRHSKGRNEEVDVFNVIDVLELYSHATEILMAQIEPKLRDALGQLFNDVLVRTFNDFGIEHNSKEYFRKSSQAANRARKELTNAPKRGNKGRPSKKALFSSEEQFITALKDVFNDLPENPEEWRVLQKLKQHPLCQKKSSERVTPNKTRVLRDWYERCDLNHEQAIIKYGKRKNRGK